MNRKPDNPESYPSLSFSGEQWSTLWLIQKGLNEATKNQLPFRAEVETGSLETVFVLLTDMSRNPAVSGLVEGAVGSIVTYVLMRQRKHKEIRITYLNPEARRALARDYMRREAGISEYQIEKETPRRDSTEFIFLDAKHNRYMCTIVPDGRVTFSKITH